MLAWYAIGVLTPANQKFGTKLEGSHWDALGSFTKSISTRYVSQESIAVGFAFRRFWLPFSLLGAFWHSKAIYPIWDSTARVDGKTDYVHLQLLIQSLRFFSIYVLPLFDASVEIHTRLSCLFLFFSVLHVVLSFNMTTLVRKAPLNLKDTSGQLDGALGTSSEGADNDLGNFVQSRLTENRSSATKSQVDLDSDGAEEDGEEHHKTAVNHDQDTMDWQTSSEPPTSTPFPAASPFALAASTLTSSASIPRMFPQPVFARPREHYFTSNPANTAFQASSDAFSSGRVGRSSLARSDSSHPPINLAQQRFFAPERPTGLENLFSAAVRLDDEPLLVRSIKSVQRTRRGPAIILLVTTIALAGALYRGDHAQLTVVLGTTIALLSTFCRVTLSRLRFGVVIQWPVVWVLLQLIEATHLTRRHAAAVASSLLWTAWAAHVCCQILALKELSAKASSRRKKTRRQ